MWKIFVQSNMWTISNENSNKITKWKAEQEEPESEITL